MWVNPINKKETFLNFGDTLKQGGILMASKITTVEINPTTRHEGHAKLVLTINDDHIIEKAYYLSTAMVRGFEYLVRERTYKFAPYAAMRICGLCPVTHGVASSEAIEDAFGIEIPRAARILRELVCIGAKLQEYPLHQLLILDDYVTNENEKEEIIKRIQKMRVLGNYITTIIGGEAIHPSNLRVGGFKQNLTKYASANLYRKFRKYEKLALDQKEVMINAIEEKIEEIGEIAQCGHSLLATHMTYGDKTEINVDAITEVLPARYYQKGEAGRDTHTMIPLYYGETVETGPRARFVKFKYKRFTGDTALHINIARARELAVLVYRGVELLDRLHVTDETMVEVPVKAGQGSGVNEAPRGTNVHQVHIRDDGTVDHYDIITPTTWNMPTMEKTLNNVPVQYAEMVVRSFDPCLACATHMVVLHNGNPVKEEVFW